FMERQIDLVGENPGDFHAAILLRQEGGRNGVPGAVGIKYDRPPLSGSFNPEPAARPVHLGRRRWLPVKRFKRGEGELPCTPSLALRVSMGAWMIRIEWPQTEPPFASGRRPVLILKAADVRQSLAMPDAIEGMKRAFAAFSSGQAVVPPRAHLPVPQHS